MPETSKFITFHIPDDRAVLAAVGEVAILHEHMNYVLRLTIKSLAQISVEEALAATNYHGSAQLRERVLKLGRKRLGEGSPLLKLQAVIANCKRLTEKRNDLVHGVWAAGMDGEEAHIRDSFGDERPVPTADELRKLGDEIATLVGRFNHDRLKGWLNAALLQSDKEKAALA
jgi:hypothetical protein